MPPQPQPHTHLILLPSPGSPPAAGSPPASFRIWHAALKSTLSSLSSSPHQTLDVGVLLAGTTSTPRRASFATLQHVLAGVYRLGAHVQAELGLDPVAPTYVDVRVYLIAADAADDDGPETAPSTTGPVFTLRQLAGGRRRYETVWIPAGDEDARRFLALRRENKDPRLAEFAVREFDAVTVTGGSADIRSSGSDASTAASGTAAASDHRIVAVGGTFDNLHEGHKLLLSAFAMVPEPPSTGSTEHQERRLVVGITGDQLLVNKKYAAMLEDWEARAAGTFRFLAGMLTLGADDEYGDESTARGHGGGVTVTRRNDPGPNGKAIEYRLPGGLMVECVEIQDPFGPTITEEDISALVVSAETRSGGKAVNDRRAEKGWRPLEVFEVDVLAPEHKDGQGARDEAEEIKVKISSTEMRKKRFEAQQGPKM